MLNEACSFLAVVAAYLVVLLVRNWATSWSHPLHSKTAPHLRWTRWILQSHSGTPNRWISTCTSLFF